MDRVGPRAMLAKLRGAAPARTVVAASPSGSLSFLVHHLPIGADLVQRSVAPGLHDFTCTTPDRAAEWLAGTLDPDRDATTTGDLHRTDDPDDVVPSDVELSECHAHTLTRLRRDGPDVRAAEVVVGAPIGVLVLRAYREGATPEYVTQHLGPADLVLSATTSCMPHTCPETWRPQASDRAVTEGRVSRGRQ